MEYRQFGHWVRIEPDQIRIGHRHVLGRGVAAAVLGLVAFVLALQVLLAAMGVTIPSDAPGYRPALAILMACTALAIVGFRFAFQSLRREQARSEDDTLVLVIDRTNATVLLPNGTVLGPAASAVQFQRIDLTNRLQGIVYRMYVEAAGRRFHIFTSGIKAEREAISAALGIPVRK